MRCAFHVRQGEEWIEDREVAPAPGTEVGYSGKTYTVDDVQWWFGGVEDDLVLTDVLVKLRAA
jgi:hypothetical protein